MRLVSSSQGLAIAAALLSAWTIPSLAQDNVSCTRNITKIPLNPFIHKETYTIGVHATTSLDVAFDENTKLFGEYLTATAGQMFDPPIQFQVSSNYFDGIFLGVENDEIDFLFANPGVYSCIGTQVGASALATVLRRISTRGRTFDLDVYAGVIAVRHDRDDINTIADLKDKIIGAGAIVDLMSGQMQIYEMDRAGMSYVNDPKQIVFTKDRVDVARGVLSGRFDVGFIRTNQIEITTDENGNPIDPELFKILEPKIYVMESGELFPFLHSTDVYPEWPLAALPSVPFDVQQAVQDALFDFGKFVSIAEKVDECLETSSTSYCDGLSLKSLVPNAPCDTTKELVDLARNSTQANRVSGFRTAVSYFELRTMQEQAGFLVQDDHDNWVCVRPKNLYEGITCPEGFFKRGIDEFDSGCQREGLSCNDKDGYDCFCQPCVRAYEVDGMSCVPLT